MRANAGTCVETPESSGSGRSARARSSSCGRGRRRPRSSPNVRWNVTRGCCTPSPNVVRSATASRPFAGTVPAVQGSFLQVHVPAAWELTVGSAENTVAVLDSGVELSHPDLAGRLDGGWDFVDDDPVPQDETLTSHGTHVTGVIGAVGLDYQGIAGIDWTSRLLPLRVLDRYGAGNVADEVQAIKHAAASGARIANLSLSGDVFSVTERDALAAAEDTLFIVSAGNDRTRRRCRRPVPVRARPAERRVRHGRRYRRRRPVVRQHRRPERGSRGARRLDHQHDPRRDLGQPERHVDGGATRDRRRGTHGRAGAARSPGGSGEGAAVHRAAVAGPRGKDGHRRTARRRRRRHRGAGDPEATATGLLDRGPAGASHAGPARGHRPRRARRCSGDRRSARPRRPEPRSRARQAQGAARAGARWAARADGNDRRDARAGRCRSPTG